jgi:mannosyltransferase OCH1-like enzyme
MQTCKTRNVPEKWKPSQDSLKKYMPSWKYVFLTDVDNLEFVNTHFPSLSKWFTDLKFPIQRADVIRYMWLFVNGGLYIDMDIEIVTSLEPLLTGDSHNPWLVKAPRNLFQHYTNFLMASNAKNPFWTMVLEECLKPLDWWVKLPHIIITKQTGISALNRAVKRWQHAINLLPYDVIVPCDYCFSTSCERPYYYTKFLQGQSWNNLDTKIFNFFSCNYELMILCLVAIVAYALVKR